MSIELAIDELAREVELAVGVPLGLQPGLPPVEIDGLLTAAGIALPSSVRRLYMHRNGVDTGDLDSVDEGTFAAMLLPEFHLMDFFQALPTSMSNVLDKPAGKFLGEYLDLPHQNFFEFLADAEGLRSFVVPAVAYDDAVVIFRHLPRMVPGGPL